MALKAMKLKNDLEKKQRRIAEIDEALEVLDRQEQENRDMFESIKDDDDVSKMEELLAADEAVENERADILSERDTLEADIDALEAEIQHLSEGTVTTRKIAKTTANEPDMRAGFNDFLHKRATGFTSTDGEVVIPEAVVYQPRDEVFTDYDLLQFVNKVSVTTASGSYPILQRATAKLVTAEELAENPELAKPQFDEVDYKVVTYRGSITISEESIADSAIDLVALIAKDIGIQKLNTTNDIVGKIMQQFTAKTVKSIDEIKTILNVDLDPAYGRRFIMTQSMFNILDQIKDQDGRYLIQRDITQGTEKRLLGYPISVVRDKLLGEEGDKKCFLGDAKAGITYFDRTQISARWIDHVIYGQLLQIGFRCDCKAVDEKAGYFITLDDSEIMKMVNLDGMVKIKSK